MPSIELRESMVLESQIVSKDGKNLIAGTFSVADVKNGNARLYKRSLWENVLSRPSVKSVLADRRMLGELGHPDCVETTLVNVSHIVTELKLLPNGTIYGEAEILDTPSGRILKTLYEAGVKLGISSRGYLPEGSNLYPEGEDLCVPDDFELITFDFVIDPSAPGAFPTLKESARSELKNILTESKEKVNPDVALFIEGLSAPKVDSGVKILKEAAINPPSAPTPRNNKEVYTAMQEKEHIIRLQAIISDLRDRYLTAEGIITDLLADRKLSEDILKEMSKRYLTSEEIIKEFKAYTLNLESTLAEVSQLQKVSEAVIADLRDRYTLSEEVVCALRDKYLVAQEDIASLKEKESLAESVIADLRDRYTLSEETITSLKGEVDAAKAVSESSQKYCKVSEDVISEMATLLTAKKQKEVPAKKPVPNSYFEGISEKYNISISEARALFKELGCKKAAYEFHLEERKKLISKPYGEFPYMIDASPIESVYESSKVSDEEKIARVVSLGF